MRRTQEEAEETRRDLLEAALTVFSAKGFRGARLETIAQEAGVTRGAIYHHFGSKIGLYMALLDDADAVGQRAIGKAIEEGGTFQQIIARILVYGFTLLEDDPRFRKVMALAISTQEVEPVARRRYQEAVTLVETVGGFFRMGMADGQVRPDLDPETAARALLGYQNGLALVWLANTDAFSIKASAPALADIFVRGFAATP